MGEKQRQADGSSAARTKFMQEQKAQTPGPAVQRTSPVPFCWMRRDAVEGGRDPSGAGPPATHAGGELGRLINGQGHEAGPWPAAPTKPVTGRGGPKRISRRKLETPAFAAWESRAEDTKSTGHMG